MPYLFQPKPRDGKQLPWYAEFVDQDRQPTRKRLSLKTLDKEAATIKAAELEKAWFKGDFDPWTGNQARRMMSFADAVEMVMEQRYSRLAESTYRNRRGILKLLGDQVGTEKDIRSITGHHLRTFLGRYEGSTHKTFFSQIRTFFNDCKRLDLIAESPIDKVIVPRTEYPMQLRVVTPDEYETLTSGIKSPWLKTLVRIGYLTGMRHGEMRHLRWENVHLDRGLIEVKNTEWHQTKSRRDRTVPIPTRLGEFLSVWKHEHLDHCWEVRRDDARDWVVLDYNGNVPSTGTAVMTFKHNRRRLGLSEDISLHKLRHTYASNAVRAGMPLHVMKVILGHANIQTTLIYAHLEVSDLQKWVGKVFD